MDYKQQVINSADQKHQDLLNDKTEPVVRTDLKLESSAPYSKNREKFVQRTEQERKAFNKAIDTVKKNGGARRNDKSRFGGIVTTTVILVVLIGIILGAYFATEGFHEWVENEITAFTGTNIAEVFNESGNEPTAAIFSGIAAITAIVLFFVCMGTLDIDSCLGKLIACVLLAALGAVVVRFALGLILFLGGYLLHYLLQPLGVAALGLVASIIILIVGRNLGSAKYKKMKWIYCLVCIGVAVIAALITSA